MAMEDVTIVKHINAIFVLRSLSEGEEYSLRGEMLVGRETECAIALDSGHISRYHAKINVSNNAVYIEDLHSTNGTFVNGERIKGRVKLHIGDEVSFDDIRYRLASSQSGNENATQLAPKRSHLSPNLSLHSPAPLTPSSANQASSSSEYGRSWPYEEPQRHLHQEPQRDLGEEPQRGLHQEPQRNLENEPQRGLGEAPQWGSNEESQQGTVEASRDIDQGRQAFSDAHPHARSPYDTPRSESSAPQRIEPVGPGSDHTQILSPMQLDRLVERNLADQKDITFGYGPRLIVMTAPQRGKVFELEEATMGASWQIGRDPEAEVCLSDKTISIDHARLAKVPEGFIITATHAKNGILINGHLKERAFLSHNDKIQMGKTELVFKTDTPEQQTSQGDAAIDKKMRMVRTALISGAVILGVAALFLLFTSKTMV